MRKQYFNSALYIFIGIFFLIAIKAAAAINCSSTIESNQIYTLTEHISINDSTCFYISVENVTIDCDGYLISGNDAVDTHGIYVNSSNVTVSGCDIENFGYGIYLNSTYNSIIYNNTINVSNNPVYLIGSINNTINNNVLISTNNTLLKISANSGNNIFYHNNFTNTTGYYIENLNDSNHYNTSIGGDPQGNHYYAIESLRIYDTDNDGWADFGSEYPLNTSTWSSKWSGFGTDYAPATENTAFAPVMINASILPGVAYSNSTLTGLCNATDADNETINYYYRWYLDNTLNTSGNVSATSAVEVNVANITSVNISQEWVFSCLASDGMQDSGWINSTTRIIGNTPPVIVSSRLYPLQLYSNETIYGYCNATDYEQDNITYYYNIYLNNALNNSGASYGLTSIESNVFNITRGYTVQQQTWILECRAGGISGNSSLLNSTPSVQKLAPQIVNASIRPNSPGLDWNLIGSCNASDGDDYTINYNYTWYKDGVANISGSVSRDGGLAVGHVHACGIRANDSVVACWGSNDYGGTLGDNWINDYLLTPQPILSDDRFVYLDSGVESVCAIRGNDSRIFCWGGNGYINLDVIEITPLNSSEQFVSVTLGSDHACAIRAKDYRVMCWGNNQNGQLGRGTYDSEVMSIDFINDSSAYKKVVAGVDITCGLRANDSAVMCWGTNKFGILGNGLSSVDNATSPYYVPNLGPAKDISLKWLTACTIRMNDSRAVCWGYNTNGEVGNGLENNTQTIPSEVNTTAEFKKIGQGYYHTCGIRKNDSRLMCWGYNINGQVGNGNSERKVLVPVDAGNGTEFSDVDGGFAITCGIRKNDSRVLCWGMKGYDGLAYIGALGDNTTTSKLYPVPTSDTSPYIDGFLSNKTADVSIIPHTYTSSAENWTFSCQAFDDNFTSQWINSSTVIIQNTHPVMFSSELTPSIRYTYDTLYGYCNATDYNEEDLSYDYVMYRNGLLNYSDTTPFYTQGIRINLTAINTLTAYSGDTWILGCRVYDGYDYSEWMNSTPITILDRPPVIISSRLYPDDLYANETIYGYCNATDYEQDIFTYYYKVYLNNSLNMSGSVYCDTSVEVNVINLTSLEKNQSWILECYAGNDDGNSSIINSTANIVNHHSRASSIDYRSTTGKNFTDDDLVVSFMLSDKDNDEIIDNSTDWRINDASIAILNMPFMGNISSLNTGSVQGIGTYKINGTLGGGSSSYAPAWVSDCLIGGCYNFAYDFIAIDNDSRLNIDTKDFSIELWFWKTGGVTGWCETFFGSIGSWPSAYGIGFGFVGISAAIQDVNRPGKLSFTYGNNNYGNTGFNSEGKYNDSQWHHAVVTMDRQGYGKMYIDGILDGQRYFANSPSLNLTGTKKYAIGALSANGDCYFNGKLDEIRFYNFTLSEEQIIANYEAGLRGEPPTIIKSSTTNAGENWTIGVYSYDGIETGANVSNIISIQPKITINSCNPNLESWSKYSLNDSINTTTSACINLSNMNDIFIDCQDYNISGEDVDGSVGILIDNSSNITIENCQVINFSTGIDVMNSYNINMIGDILDYNNYGMIMNNSAYIDSESIIIRNNTYGLSIYNSSDANLSSMIISGSTNEGIRHMDSEDIIFRMSENEREYTGEMPKILSNSAFREPYLNYGYWPLVNESGEDITEQSDTAWYSGSYGGRNPDGSFNRSLRYYHSIVNASDDPNPGYRDVLLITVANNPDSVNISKYFVEQRGIEHLVEVTLPGDAKLGYNDLINEVVNPIKDYLRDYNGTINYLVTTKGMPVNTFGIEYGDIFNAYYNASSVDSELALVGSDYENTIGMNLYINNPYYNGSAYFISKWSGRPFNATPRFNTTQYNGTKLVTRLDGASVADAKALLDRARSINYAYRNSQNAIELDVYNYLTEDCISVNQTLINAGLNVTANCSGSGSSNPSIRNIPYYNISWANYYRTNAFTPPGVPNITWVNGSFALMRFSFASVYINEAYLNHDWGLAAATIRSGATSVYGASQEPFVSTSAKETVLVWNFLHGSYFADSYWNSLPAFSYGANVFADPKATHPYAEPSIWPANVTTSSNISCRTYVTHPPGRYLNLTYEWYKNGVNQTVLGGSVNGLETESIGYIGNVSYQNLTLDDTWFCRIIMLLNGEFSSDFNSSSIIVQSSSPVVISAYILPTDADTDSVLKGYCNATDYDQDNLTYYYKWYKDDNESLSNMTNTSFGQGTLINLHNISTESLSEGETWIFSCLASDSISNSGWQNSTPVIIEDNSGSNNRGGGNGNNNGFNLQNMKNDNATNNTYNNISSDNSTDIGSDSSTVDSIKYNDIFNGNLNQTSKAVKEEKPANIDYEKNIGQPADIIRNILFDEQGALNRTLLNGLTLLIVVSIVVIAIKRKNALYANVTARKDHGISDEMLKKTLSYISKVMVIGYSEETIKEYMKRKGWKEEQIGYVFSRYRINQEILEKTLGYISKVMGIGYSEETIKEYMKRKGWKEMEIEYAFSEYEKIRKQN